MAFFAIFTIPKYKWPIYRIKQGKNSSGKPFAMGKQLKFDGGYCGMIGVI